MARLKQFGPKGVGVALPSRSRTGGISRSTNAVCVMYEDRSNYVVFRLRGNGVTGGAAGNRWKVLLYKVSSGRFAFRLINPKNEVLVTITRTGGVSNLMAGVNANATVKRLVRMQIVGTIDDDTTFASSLTDYCKFSGGS
jgi:hypothetical protein|tara:strand:- start:314 stop:733 length:420 start_codon:yes stop_codon:yes gene_type:complete